jgi:hypothetical protein
MKTLRFEADTSRIQVYSAATLSVLVICLFLIGSVKYLVFTSVKHENQIQNMNIYENAKSERSHLKEDMS